MKAGKAKKQSSLNSRINLSQTLEGKNPNQLTIIQLHENKQQQKSIYHNRGASKLISCKSQQPTSRNSRKKLSHSLESKKDQTNQPAYYLNQHTATKTQHNSSYMPTYYSKIRKSRRRKRKAKFWEKPRSKE